MILTAWSEGVASNWVGFENLTAVKPLLGIPEQIDVVGHPALRLRCQANRQGSKKKRKPLSESLTMNASDNLSSNPNPNKPKPKRIHPRSSRRDTK